MEVHGQTAPATLSSASGLSGLGSRLRRVAFGGLAALILFGPAPGQLFGHHSPALREWVMYSGVGVGILRGSFVLQEGERRLATLSPLEALGLQRYPSVRHYQFPHLVRAPEDVAAYAAALCERAAPGQTVAFEGQVGTRQGWREMSSADLCALGAERQATAGTPAARVAGLAR
jgi:hypothetical protein